MPQTGDDSIFAPSKAHGPTAVKQQIAAAASNFDHKL